MRYTSPLRYPGGKTRLAPLFMRILEEHNLQDGWYCEPYAGGAGVALSLLYEEYVQDIYINDFSYPIYSFWKAVLDSTEELCRLVADTPVNVEEWRRQREIYLQGGGVSPVDLGFATLFLNRTNRSGIIRSGGVIGGLEQSGNWKIDARFPREELVRRIERVARYRSRISLTCLDAAEFLNSGHLDFSTRGLLYLDPPYFRHGERLYDKSYEYSDHEEIAICVSRLNCPWIVTYDDCAEINALYSEREAVTYRLGYSAAVRRSGRERMFFSSGIRARTPLCGAEA